MKGLVADEDYARAVEDVKAFLGGRQVELVKDLKRRMTQAADDLEFEKAAGLRDLIATVEEMAERQRMAAVEGRDIDIVGFYAEPPLVAANLFHVRNGRVVDRREFFWEDLREFERLDFLSALLTQIYLDQQYVPSLVHVPEDFDDRPVLEDLLSEKRGRKVEINVPLRGAKKAMLDLVGANARQGFEQRFRILKPGAREIAAAWREALNLPQPEKGEESSDRIECFDISHTQGVEVVASMVVWECGRMKKADYRRFIVKRQTNDDFAAMREVVGRRYRRLKDERKPFPVLTLVDGGLGQLHAAAEALEELGAVTQPLAAIAKREETIYVFGQEDEPIRLDRFNPILRMIQQIRDEAHRFAIAFHRSRRGKRAIASELLEIPGIGERTAQKLLREFGSLDKIRECSADQLAAAVNKTQAGNIRAHFHGPPPDAA